MSPSYRVRKSTPMSSRARTAEPAGSGVERQQTAVSVQASGPALKFEAVDKHFPGVHALKRVSLEVMPGEVLGLVGENGAGKSTLMGVAAGSLTADSGDVMIYGERLDPPTPRRAAELGLAIVYQEPALLPDLRVAENLQLAAAAHGRVKMRGMRQRAAAALRSWRGDASLEPSQYVRDLPPDRRFIVEISKAIAQNPKVLILDEPTEHLARDDVAALFDAVRAAAERGCAVIYISHRIHEVKDIADRIAVLRDGEIQGTFAADSVSEEEIINLVVGRPLDAMFPPKPVVADDAEIVLACRGFTSHNVSALDLNVRAGEIIGLAGIEDHGQRDLVRALAGLQPAAGEVVVAGHRTSLGRSPAAARSGIAYIPNDRHAEGVFETLSVRENLTARVIRTFTKCGVIIPRAERDGAARIQRELGVRAASLETQASTLSGGNQQKTVLGRALADKPRLILADEPTQGVDVGARSEIYGILHRATARGAAAIVVSSDAAELAGLCTRILVFSRGHVVRQLTNQDVSEERITEAVLTSTTSRDAGAHRPYSGFRQFLRGDLAPSVVIVIAILALGAYTAAKNSDYLTTRNFTGMLTLFAILAFVSVAQQAVMMVGGIDLSVGPLAGLTVVAGSFLLASDKTGAALVPGIAALAAIALLVGITNWLLIQFLKITPMIATLVTYTLLQGISLLLRPTPGGSVSNSVTNALSRGVGFIPVAAIVVVVLGFALDVAMRRSLWGLRLRAVGSRSESAARNGVRSSSVMLSAYVLCALCAVIAGLLLLVQTGSGDATVGTAYTLPSITAVVLGGASIFGGRGSFIGALLGALLIQQLDTVTVFLHLSTAWQYYLLGALTLVATGFYSKVRAHVTH